VSAYYLPMAGESPVRTMDRDILCPDCGYNLRGHSGPVLVCPECGRGWKSELLVGSAGPPLAGRLRSLKLMGDAMVIAIITGEVALLCLLILFASAGGNHTGPRVGMAVLGAGWAVACFQFCRHQRSFGRGLWLLAHTLSATMLLVAGVLVCLSGLAFNLVRGLGPIVTLAGAGCAAAGLVLWRRTRRMCRHDELLELAVDKRF